MYCHIHNLVLLSDEVYQENGYGEGDEFFSSRRAAYELGLIKSDTTVLFPFHLQGSFGRVWPARGYVEMAGIVQDVNEILYKLAATKLCSNTSGQAMTSLMCRGLDAGDVSYQSFEEEKRAVFEGLKDHALLVSNGLDSIPRFSCQPAPGAMYCFPSVQMPTGFIKALQEKGCFPYTLYTLDLLQSTGICVVPAYGFGQRAGRFAFSTAFLSLESKSVS